VPSSSVNRLTPRCMEGKPDAHPKVLQKMPFFLSSSPSFSRDLPSVIFLSNKAYDLVFFLLKARIPIDTIHIPVATLLLALHLRAAIRRELVPLLLRDDRLTRVAGQAPAIALGSRSRGAWLLASRRRLRGSAGGLDWGAVRTASGLRGIVAGLGGCAW